MALQTSGGTFRICGRQRGSCSRGWLCIQMALGVHVNWLLWPGRGFCDVRLVMFSFPNGGPILRQPSAVSGAQFFARVLRVGAWVDEMKVGKTDLYISGLWVDRRLL